MKITCNKCRAFIEEICTLGYHQEAGKPRERCHQPLTIKKMNEAKKQLTENKN